MSFRHVHMTLYTFRTLMIIAMITVNRCLINTITAFKCNLKFF